MPCHLKMLPNWSMYKMKRLGPSTEPCGTPWLTLVYEEDSSFTRTNWNLSDKYDLNQPNAVPLTPITCSSYRMLWSTVLNAALRSNRTNTGTSWVWFCQRFLPVNRESFLSTVASCMLGTGNWTKEKYQVSVCNLLVSLARKLSHR